MYNTLRETTFCTWRHVIFFVHSPMSGYCILSYIPMVWPHVKVVRQRTSHATSCHSFITTFWKWRPVEIFRCQESFRDIIIVEIGQCWICAALWRPFWKWWLVEIFRCQESFQDIIIYPHVTCRWNRTMLNLCGIVTAILKMATWYIYRFTSIDWEWLPWYFVCNQFTWKLKMWTGLCIRYYDTFSKIQRIQSINKQTEYDNLVLEQDILSKKKR